MNLQEWRKLSFQLTADLQTLSIEAQRHGLDRLAEEAEALRARVEERRFTVAVVGDFRRGKSTFINALLGRPILPSDVAPTTATVNRITYGTKPRVELHFHDGRPSEQIPVEELAEHVTKLSEAAEQRASAIREAVVTWPVRFCRNDVDILDTPGLGDEATMTAVTLRQLPGADAAILVIMADSPFSETEGDFLDRLYAEGVTELLFVVSAMDRVRRPADRERLLDGIRERVAARIRRTADARFAPGSPEHAAFLARHGSPRVFGVSALLALEGRESEGVDAGAAIEASGMPAFEQALETFLAGADEVGLRRRLEQAEALTRQFAPPSSSAEVAPTSSAELVRLGALLQALEGAIQEHRRRLGDACARTVVGVEDLLALLPGQVQALAQEDLRTSLGPYWPQRFGDFAVEVGGKIAASVNLAVASKGPELTRRLNEELAGLSTAEATLARVVEYVLAYVGAQLTRLGCEAATPPRYLAVGDVELDVAAMAASLTPAVAAFVEVIDDPTVVSSLQAVSKRSVFDALLALDFGGLQGRLVAVALPRVLAVVEASWATRPPSAALREQMEHVMRAHLAAIEPLAQAVRAASADLVAARERASHARALRARDFAAGARTVAAITGRLRAAAEALDRG